MTMTTEELIAEIERLDAAATSGPWKASGAGADSWVFAADGRRFDIGDRLYHPENDANAHLIASYRTLAVEAAKRLRELQASHEAVMSAVATENFEVLLYAKGLNHPVELILLSTEDGIRKALNERHKERKAAKPPKQYKAAPFLAGTVGTWIVKTIPECRVIATFPPRNSIPGEADARAFAKMKNKQARGVTE